MDSSNASNSKQEETRKCGTPMSQWCGNPSERLMDSSNASNSKQEETRKCGTPMG